MATANLKLEVLTNSDGVDGEIAYLQFWGEIRVVEAFLGKLPLTHKNVAPGMAELIDNRGAYAGDFDASGDARFAGGWIFLSALKG